MYMTYLIMGNDISTMQFIFFLNQEVFINERFKKGKLYSLNKIDGARSRRNIVLGLNAYVDKIFKEINVNSSLSISIYNESCEVGD